jgi:predicted metalloprotease with PDZ domain
MRQLRLLLAVLLVLAAPAVGWAQAAIAYRISFAEAQHRLMQVEVTFTEVPAGPLQVRMSRSSPGRYAIHEFAKNVFDVRITDTAGRTLAVSRPNPHQWDVTGHQGTVRVTYRIFGDRVDGTYLGVDSTHAHINIPSALMWARGLEQRPATVRFEPPAGSGWRVGTQLLPGADQFTFTAPNLQYLMDSPTEVSAFALRTFTVSEVPASPTFRIVLHHTGTDQDLDAYAGDVQKIVREMRHVFGEYPAFEGNTYTFIADYLPWASGDGMEHRNSTILTSAASLRGNRLGLLGTVSHEFFHVWNVERIRPRSLEPFNFEDANMSGELWLAEGFTSYYGPLVLMRSGITELRDFVEEMGDTINQVLTSPGRGVRSPEEMSRFAPFVDAATSIDPTSFDNTFISYYTWGEALGLGLDLALRARSDGVGENTVTLDHFMRALWVKHGKPGGRAPGLVDNPYTMADLRAALADVSGDAAFANNFFDRYIQGREVVDYAPLLARAGLTLRLRQPGRATAGDWRLQDVQGRPRIADIVPLGSPAYDAGLDRDDIIVAVAGANVSSAVDVDRAIAARRPGDRLQVTYDRRGQRLMTTIQLAQDPAVELVANEAAGQAVSAQQMSFRNAWLSSRSGN